MKHLNRGIATLVMLIGGAVTSLILALILGIIQAKLHFALYGFSFWLVIPVGAIFAGFIAAIGYRIGFSRYPYRPTIAVVGGVIVISAATYFAIHYFSYVFTNVKGMPASQVI